MSETIKSTSDSINFAGLKKPSIYGYWYIIKAKDSNQVPTKFVSLADYQELGATYNVMRESNSRTIRELGIQLEADSISIKTLTDKLEDSIQRVKDLAHTIRKLSQDGLH